MFVAHNYAGAEAFKRLRAKGGEGGFWWRDIVIPLLRGSGIDPSRAFFTNALMGLKDGPSVGNMNASKQFESECSLFLQEQIRIVQPSGVVAFGADAYQRVRLVTSEVAKCLHLLPGVYPIEIACRASQGAGRRATRFKVAAAIGELHQSSSMAMRPSNQGTYATGAFMELVTDRILVDKYQGIIATACCSERGYRFSRLESLSRCSYYLAQPRRWFRR